MNRSVGELAKLAGVTVRTLHHYDAIGLLSPSERSAAGYRQYSDADAERLFRIIVYRQLGFDLAGIAEILDRPAADALEHLRRQHSLLTEQVGRLHTMIDAVEAMMRAKENGYNMTPDEMREVFGAFDPAEHEAEAESRWGDTDAHRQSQRRAKGYGKQQWLEIRREAEAIEAGLAAAMQQGLPPDGAAAMDLAEQHRQHIGRWFYDCSYEMHSGLGEMYVADPRFAQHYEDVAPGLSRYMHDAVRANAARGQSA
ncbi:MAG TPA: MerR family transcriptional regulator [Longimicrobiales bacterium]|nr:MerR family transcriptional regulator [Longimicrobiales bacterium]